MRAEGGEKNAGDNVDVQGKETAERLAPEHRSTHHQIHQRRTDVGNPADHCGPNPQAPVGVGIPAEHLTGKRHSDGAEK